MIMIMTKTTISVSTTTLLCLYYDYASSAILVKIINMQCKKNHQYMDRLIGHIFNVSSMFTHE